jgi:hypothetical protein
MRLLQRAYESVLFISQLYTAAFAPSPLSPALCNNIIDTLDTKNAQLSTLSGLVIKARSKAAAGTSNKTESKSTAPGTEGHKGKSSDEVRFLN